MTLTERITVLHVDDDVQFGELTKTMLEREHDTFEVITESDPREVEGLLDKHEVDCLVSDYDMPRIDGIELLKRTRENNPTLPLILFTGKGTEEVASRAISVGVTEYLQKEGGADQFTVLANRILNAVEHKTNERKREQYRTVVETAGDAMLVLDEDGHIEIVNDALERMSGYDREKLIGNHVSEFLSPDQVQQGKAAIQSLLQDGDRDSERFTFRKQRPDGVLHLYEMTLSLVERNGFAGSVATIRDITDERRKEELLSGLFEESLHGIGVKEIVTDDSGEPVDYIYKRVNDRFEELTGLDADDVVGKRATEAIDGIEDTPFIDIFGEVALDGTTAQFEQYFEPLDRYYEVSAFSPRQGECISIFSDITERKNHEQELESEREFIEESINALDDTFYLVDVEGNFQRWNETLPKLTGYTDEEIDSMNALEFFEGEHITLIEEAIRDILQTGSNVTEAEITTKDGRQIPHEFRGVRMTDDTGQATGIIGIAREITTRKQRESDLKAERDRLDEFASFVSHDLRNPLNVATLRTELAAQECDSDHLSDVAEALSRMEELIDDLLLLARQGATIGDRETLVLQDLAVNCWRTVETGDATIIADGETTLAADRGRLTQILENLFRNAIDHVGGSVTVTVGVLDDKNGFYVADDGPGIPKEDREDIFESGFTRSSNGTGFGLAIVSQICTAHGWDVTVTEDDTGGARFEITGVESIQS